MKPRKGFFKTEDEERWLKLNTLWNNGEQRLKVQFGATPRLRKFPQGDEQLLKVKTCEQNAKQPIPNLAGKLVLLARKRTQYWFTVIWHLPNLEALKPQLYKDTTNPTNCEMN